MASGKRTGKRSQTSNDFLQPLAPTIDSVSDVGTNRAYNDGAITVSFSLPGNSQPATSYTASAYCSVHNATHTATGASSPLTITGFGSNVTTTVTVVASNSYGDSPASAASSSVTVTTVPATPSAPSASTQASAANDDVSWSAPADGGKAITNYHWESNDGKSGDTASTSVTVGQEAGTAQSYRVYATNANGNSSYSSYSGQVTTFSFTPFSFAPFGAFGFTPFGAFGFTPFGAFGFTPFGAFGFTPFGAFGFSPPSCIHEDTLIRTSSGMKAAKDVQIGDTVISVGLSEIPTGGSEGDFDYVGFTSESLTSTGTLEVNVVDVVPQTKNASMWFNGDTSKKYSLSQPFFIKRGASYEVVPSSTIEEGDKLIKINEDGSISEVNVSSIEYDMSECTVYQFNCEPQDWFIAGDYLVHNK